jgi:outer membrane protein OmpA-like peptidoglycan-associated protein
LRHGQAGALAALAALLMLAGCGDGVEGGGPVSWWHTLEGGSIATHRPPPPGAFDPYPNLASVPPKPKPASAADQAEVTATLAADRADATYAAAQLPLASNTPPRDSAGLFAPAPPLPPPSADAAGAALPAAATPDHAASPPPAAPPASLIDAPMPQIVPETTPPPPIPDQPPAPPRLQGVSIPITIPHLPPKAPPTPPPGLGALSKAAAAPIGIAFPTGSARLAPAAIARLDTLAASRGGHPIAITGFGEAEGEDAQSQYAGVALGLARARAIAAVLVGDGVPATDLRLAASAPGRGAAARLLD